MFSHIIGIIHAVKNIDAQEKAVETGDFSAVNNYQAFAIIDKSLIESFLIQAGLGLEYIEKIQNKTKAKVKIIGQLDYFDQMERLKRIFALNALEGWGLRDFMDRIPKDDIMRGLGMHRESPWYLETVYRTNFTSAHSAGRWKTAQNKSSVIMLQFVGLSDDRQTDICEQCHGTIKPKKDEFWDKYTPANHYNCRSDITELTRGYIAALGLEPTSPNITAETGKGFDTNPGKRNGWMYPTKGMRSRLNSYLTRIR